jgi:hypothetical protein
MGIMDTSLDGDLPALLKIVHVNSVVGTLKAAFPVDACKHQRQQANIKLVLTEQHRTRLSS